MSTNDTQALLRQALAALESCGAGAVEDGGQQWFDDKLVDAAHEAIESHLATLASRQDQQGQAWQAPEGWKLVPITPTPEMMCAAWDHTPPNMDDMTDGDFGQAYKDMIAAAPLPPAGKEPTP